MDKYREKLVKEDYSKSITERKNLIRPKISIDNMGIKMGIIILTTAFISTILGIIIVNYLIMPRIIGYGSEINVPDITGMKIEKAKRILNQNNLELRIVDEVYSEKIEQGYVISQTPLPNTRIKFNRTIDLVISKGMEKTAIPYVIDLFLKDAVDILEQAGFIIEDTLFKFSEEINEGNIVGTNPSAEILIPKGSKIQLFVSKGKKSDYVKIPSFIGLTPDSARTLARGLKIIIGEINEQYGNIDRPTVIIQSIDSGQYVLKHDTINLTIQIPGNDNNE